MKGLQQIVKFSLICAPSFCTPSSLCTPFTLRVRFLALRLLCCQFHHVPVFCAPASFVSTFCSPAFSTLPFLNSICLLSLFFALPFLCAPAFFSAHFFLLFVFLLLCDFTFSSSHILHSIFLRSRLIAFPPFAHL